MVEQGESCRPGVASTARRTAKRAQAARRIRDVSARENLSCLDCCVVVPTFKGSWEGRRGEEGETGEFTFRVQSRLSLLTRRRARIEKKRMQFRLKFKRKTKKKKFPLHRKARGCELREQGCVCVSQTKWCNELEVTGKELVRKCACEGKGRAKGTRLQSGSESRQIFENSKLHVGALFVCLFPPSFWL